MLYRIVLGGLALVVGLSTACGRGGDGQTKESKKKSNAMAKSPAPPRIASKPVVRAAPRPTFKPYLKEKSDRFERAAFDLLFYETRTVFFDAVLVSRLARFIEAMQKKHRANNPTNPRLPHWPLVGIEQTSINVRPSKAVLAVVRKRAPRAKGDDDVVLPQPTGVDALDAICKKYHVKRILLQNGDRLRLELRYPLNTVFLLTRLNKLPLVERAFLNTRSGRRTETISSRHRADGWYLAYRPALKATKPGHMDATIFHYSSARKQWVDVSATARQAWQSGWNFKGFFYDAPVYAFASLAALRKQLADRTDTERLIHAVRVLLELMNRTQKKPSSKRDLAHKPQYDALKKAVLADRPASAALVLGALRHKPVRRAVRGLLQRANPREYFPKELKAWREASMQGAK